MAKTVIAIEKAFYKGNRIRVGDELVIGDKEKLAKWMEPKGKPADPEKEAKAKALADAEAIRKEKAGHPDDAEAARK